MITKYSGDGLWFTSDTHFCHNNILRLCNRPWDNIDEHDKALIDNWNSVVNPDDTVFHLGDFVFGGAPKWKDIRQQLNGHIILIKGNHDDHSLQQSLYSLFEDVVYQARIMIDGRTVYLNHFPFLCFAHSDPQIYNDSYAINLFGHVHSRIGTNGYDTGRLQYLYPTQYDVGVDNNTYTPISWQNVDNIIKKQIENLKYEISD